MGSTNSYASPRTMRRSQNRVRFDANTGYGPITRTVLLVLLIGTLGLMYLTQITKTSAYGYQVSELEERRDELQDENESLRVEAARLQSIERVRNSDYAKDLSGDKDVSLADAQ